jgi:hypothetical protein
MLFVLKMTYLACADIHQPVLVGLDTFADICQPTLPGLDTFVDIRQTRPHSPKGFFEKNVTRFDTFAQVIRHSGKFGASGHCLVDNQILVESGYVFVFYLF